MNQWHHEHMNAYSEDLRKKIIQALRRGMGKSEAARTFSVSLSSVKRYTKMAEEGRSLAPKKRPGSKPKTHQNARRLLEADLQARPAATLSERCEFLERVCGLRVSNSTISRLLRRMGFTRKKDFGCQRTRRVLESGLACVSCRGSRRTTLGVRG